MGNTRSKTIGGREFVFEDGVDVFEGVELGCFKSPEPDLKPSNNHVENNSNAERLGDLLRDGRPKDQLDQTSATWPSPIKPAARRSEFSEYLEGFGIRNHQELQALPILPEKTFTDDENGAELLDPSARISSDRECSCYRSVLHRQQQCGNLQQSDGTFDPINQVLSQEAQDEITDACTNVKRDEPKMELDPYYCPLDSMDRAMKPYAHEWERRDRLQDRKRRRMTAEESKRAKNFGRLRSDNNDSSSDKTLSGDEKGMTDSERDAMVLRARTVTAECRADTRRTRRWNYQATAVHFNRALHGRAPATPVIPAARVRPRQATFDVPRRQSAAPSAPAAPAPTTAGPMEVDEETIQVIQPQPPAPSQAPPGTAAPNTIAEAVRAATAAANRSFGPKMSKR